MDFLINIDRSVFLFLNKTVANPVFDIIMPFITNKDHFMIPIALAVLVLLIFGGKEGRIAILLGIIVLTLSDQIAYSVIKPWVHRLRPCHPDHLIEGARYLIGFKKSFSFPSNHAANNAAMALFFSVKYPKAKWVLIPIALAVGYSRIYVGVHFPLDVLAGFILGLLCAWGVLAFEKWFRRKWREKKTSNSLQPESSS